MLSLFQKLFKDANQKEVNRFQDLVDQVNQLEPGLEKLSDEALTERSLKLKKKVRSNMPELLGRYLEVNPDFQLSSREIAREVNRLLEEEMAEGFALVREAAKRTIGLRHYDVQLIGGAVLHQGKIAEMATGEGKTLVASLALYLNALTGLGAHLVTVNDYLARRDAGWMGPIYQLLGLSVGVIGPEFSYVYDQQFVNNEDNDRLKHLKMVERAEAYQSDITYGTNNEFGFDYLRDNMAQAPEQLVQRQLAYAIIDEVDSILIDEARTPLIISAPSQESAQLYQQFAGIVTKLKLGFDYEIDEKTKGVSLQENGIKKLEQLIGVANLYDPNNVRLVHHADVALRASALYKKNRDYVVKEDEIIIVDEFTGRLLQGRRYSGGLHQAIEAKEKVNVREESVTLATVTFQNLFRLYGKLAGMTGTASTEAEEFAKIYSLEVVTIPTHRPNIRLDRQDAIYKTETAKFKAVAELVKDRQSEGQPVLIGTVSISKSQKLSQLLKSMKIEHTVLNAKLHQKEGEIVAQAGRPGAVTVATNMAGRGVDIILGGLNPNLTESKDKFKIWEKDHQRVLDLGGLFVVGTERHESRRIDNQLRGRSGRQGDPGVSQFFLSMEDDLMRIFGGDRMKNIMERLNIPEEMAINNRLLSRAIEQAQSKVEGHNFEIRKQLVEYDDVINKHREAIYRKRRSVLNATSPDSLAKLWVETLELFDEQQRSILQERAKEWPELLRGQVVRSITLRAIDILWVEHLQVMDDLRESIGLRGYGQREPIVEYKQEALRLFQLLQENIDGQIVEMLLHAQIDTPVSDQADRPPAKLILSGPDEQSVVTKTPATTNKKTGRNDPCPCGAIDPQTGKVYKYKKCGLINASYHRG